MRRYGPRLRGVTRSDRFEGEPDDPRREMTDTTQVVVIGGGYAGVLAANRLRQRTDVHVTLVNRRPAFVERIRLHQLVAGNNDAVEDYAPLLAEGVRLVVDDAERIDAAA